MPPIIEPYNPRWKLAFESIKEELAAALSGLAGFIDIQHVGSTALAGLPAKPVLDIDIIIEDKRLLPAITARLENIGYLSKGEQGIPGRFAFRQQSAFVPSAEMPVPHHLYVCYADSLALKNHLLFRDTLKNNPALLQQYAALKVELASGSGVTREQYTKGKTAFILSVLAKAGMSSHELGQIAGANS